MDRAQLTPRTVSCWSYGAWLTVTLYYPPVDKCGIEPTKHLAVIEDNWLASSGAQIAKSKTWKQGQSKAQIENYLMLNGPAIVKQIAEDMESKANLVTGVLMRNPDVFCVVGYEMRRAGRGMNKAAVWGLTEKGA